jgi:hypothetical protein
MSMEVFGEHRIVARQTLAAGKDIDVSKSQVRAWLVALGASALGIGLVYHVQFSSGFDLFPGPRGDTRLAAYLLEHWYQVLSGRGELLSPGMFYPVKGTLAFSDIYLIYVPVYALFRLARVGSCCTKLFQLALLFLPFKKRFAIWFARLMHGSVLLRIQ